MKRSIVTLVMVMEVSSTTCELGLANSYTDRKRVDWKILVPNGIIVYRIPEGG